MATLQVGAPTARKTVSRNPSVSGVGAPQPTRSGGPHAASPDADELRSLVSEELSQSAEGKLEDRGVFASSFDEADTCSSAQLGYKDELERRFIWDRVLGKGAHTHM